MIRCLTINFSQINQTSFSFLVSSVFAGPVELVDGKYPRFFDYPDADGNIQKVDLLEPADTEFLNEIQRNPDGNQYFLFTRSHALIKNDK